MDSSRRSAAIAASLLFFACASPQRVPDPAPMTADSCVNICQAAAESGDES
jgi:hypothetical protein